MPKRYPREFRRAVCERLLAGEPVSRLSEVLSVSQATLHLWKSGRGGGCRGFGGGDAEFGQQAAVVGLHPFLGQAPVVVVPEGADHFPFEGLPGGFDWADR